MEGKIITCCGDCVYYDWKKHKCKNGYSDESNPKSHFYSDCKQFESVAEHDIEICRKFAERLKEKFNDTNITEYGFYPNNLVDETLAEMDKES